MHHEIVTPPDPRYVVVVTHGMARLDGFVAFTDELVRRRLPSTATAVLVDHRDLDLSSMLKPDVDAFRRHVAGVLSTRPQSPTGKTPRLASLVARTLDFGIVRQWEIPLEGEVPLLHRAFLDHDAAMAWLLAQPEAAPGE